ncbi:putative 1,4-butanediol diacrylate esterase [Saitoella complicata NRRL Y-17804]|uniref:putative 1,4-butanediol diacrylate esterase n=1 Tax=Saitoella complicata (strain BCRC 22490 / CBS 7301 / JCM 7358 / NBRC 10748 / NRRL Y-17804) TaxID=698492 RepID=UPI000866E80D|nr:putative 1,4-butanediol diacrylate esterase [Saitoella complicata NRRL Y-17804]ODQ49699.1 putative 1,4-butanediol diacrylate esterase [Saitoella complicata NRRL Y-17804]
MTVSTSTEIDQILQSFTDRKDGIPGVVCRAVDKEGNVLYEGVSGLRGLNDESTPMTTDSVFWIASFTKLITTIAVMQLVEQGKVELDTPAEQYLDQIGKFRVLEGHDENDKPIFREPKTKITLRMMLTHTSGHTYDFFNHNHLKHNKLNNISAPFSTKRDTIMAPLGFEPGTRWEYGLGIDWCGQVVETITGMSLGDYFQKNIFEPLGCKDTSFTPTKEQMGRHAKLHMRREDGTLTQREYEIADDVEVHLGGAGCHSTAADYTAILACLLNDGRSPTTGAQLLKKATVDDMFQDQTTPRGISLEEPIPNPLPHLSNPLPNLMPGVRKGWGLSFLISHDALPTGRSAGSVWWAGIANCYWWADREKGVAGVTLTQIFPFADVEVFELWGKWEGKVYEGLKA